MAYINAGRLSRTVCTLPNILIGERNGEHVIRIGGIKKSVFRIIGDLEVQPPTGAVSCACHGSNRNS